MKVVYEVREESLVGVKSLHVISCVQKVGFKRKKHRDHEEI